MEEQERERDYHRVKRAVNGDYEGKREDEDLPSDDSIKGQTEMQEACGKRATSDNSAVIPTIIGLDLQGAAKREVQVV